MYYRCRENNTGPKVGGADVEETVRAVFAALIWHTQSLREEIDKMSKAILNSTLKNVL